MIVGGGVVAEAYAPHTEVPENASCDANVSTSESEEAAAARARAVVADIECRFLDMSS